MDITTLPDYDDHELVVFARDAEAGLTAMIAVHSTVAGPAVGGTRMWSYVSTEAALTDVLRLSRGMTFKNVMAGLPLGGGKSVIIGDARTDKSEALFRAFGRRVDALGGTYVCAEDVGTGPRDMAIVAQETRHVAGLEGGAGDPSPVTAWGVYHGIRAAAKEAFGSPDLSGRVIAVQGLGSVGRSLCGFLAEEGARLVVADLDRARAEGVAADFGATTEDAAAIHAVECDIFAPCALGGAISERSLPDLRCAVVAGAANNQLATPHMGRALHDRGILYAPDYVINAGGIIAVAGEIAGAFDRAAVMAKAAAIGDTLTEIFQRSQKTCRPPADVADAIALERLAAIKERRRAA